MAIVIEDIQQLRSRVGQELGVSDWPLLTAQQVHGNDVVAITEAPVANTEFPGCSSECR